MGEMTTKEALEALLEDRHRARKTWVRLFAAAVVAGFAALWILAYQDEKRREEQFRDAQLNGYFALEEARQATLRRD